MKQIEVFTGNRAEFGILISLIKALSKCYKINLIVTGAHLLNKWNTVLEIFDKTKDIKNIEINRLIITNKNDNIYDYAGYLSQISKAYLDYKKKSLKKIKFCLFLGDRIETAAYAFSAFYLNQILIHIGGGDIANIPAYDTNIRHALTKLAHLHLVTNSQSYKIVKQLGEEEWRIANIGMPSLDIVHKGSFIDKKSLCRKFNLSSNEVVIATYHPDQYMSASQNLTNFKKMIKGLYHIKYKVILTYPNNDPGHEKIITEIENNVSKIKSISIIKNLGTDNYMGILKNFKTILVGNSSGVLTESAYFLTPALLIGGRQISRLRGKNVTELVRFTPEDIVKFIEDNFENYEEKRKFYYKTQFIYGDGHSAGKAKKFLDNVFHKRSFKEIITKNFERIK